MMSLPAFDSAYASEQLRRSRHPLRRLVKSFYIRNILQDVRGPAIDLGCGAGQLLRRLPPGSIGLEVNPDLVSALQAASLNVRLYDPVRDRYEFGNLPQAFFKTLVAAHVLEHLSDVPSAMVNLCRGCLNLGVERIIAVVPGQKGFRSDPTHRTFISLKYLQENGLFVCEGYRLVKSAYFPINVESLGGHFTFHELKLVYDRSC